MNNAKSYENIGKRIHITCESLPVLLEDTYHNLQVALERDGSTGKLSNPDGILRGVPQIHRGFFIQCFGMPYYESELTIYPKVRWFGFAKREVMLRGKKVTIEFDIQSVRQQGFDTEHEAGKHLFEMADKFQENWKN